MRLEGPDGDALALALSGRPVPVPANSLDEQTQSELLAAGFLVPCGVDELTEIRRRYWAARAETPMVVTITTTQDCNLGCYYCYEERSTDHLTPSDIPDLVHQTETRLRRSGKRSLHVDWYGGEPLLNIAFLESASAELQALCQRLQVRYEASIISNGTCWPADIGTFLTQNQITQVQITFDGMRDHHNRRRRYRKEYDTPDGASSFDQAVAVVDSVLDYARLDLRINIDHANQNDLVPLIQFARERGWFQRRYPIRIQPARLSAYTESSAFLRPHQLTPQEYDDVRAIARDQVGADADVVVEEPEIPGGFPVPKSSVCAALANDSFVLGAEGLHYRCGLQVGVKAQAVGHLLPTSRPQLGPSGPHDNRRSLPMADLTSNDAEWWANFDPTTMPNCSRCSFLPICWSGCAKKHLEGDTHAIAEQGRYYRTHLARWIAARAGTKPLAGYSISEQDQFRS
ncbi:MAG: radical SAM protein [Gemmataceae bacterium]